jgi:hypothetical protein
MSPGSFVCAPCPKGYWNSVPGGLTCLACALGTYGDSMGLQECLSCPEGTIASTLGKTACDKCDAGRYSMTKASSQCLDCPVGTAAPNKVVTPQIESNPQTEIFDHLSSLSCRAECIQPRSPPPPSPCIHPPSAPLCRARQSATCARPEPSPR